MRTTPTSQPTEKSTKQAAKKVLAVSSPGGHWIQLNKICDGLQHYQIIYATPAKQFKANQQSDKKIYDIVDVSADNKLKLLSSALQLFYIILKERPQVILSTGAAPGVVAIMLGKLLGKTTIWVDSIANVRQLSRSGQMIKHRAHHFITQWEHLSDNEHIQHKGAVL